MHKTHLLNPADTAWLAETLKRNHARFDGWSMEADPSAPAPSDPPPADPQPADPPADPGRTFTQADVDRIIAGRLAKYADYDDIRQQVADLAPLREQFAEVAKVFGVGSGDTPPDPEALAAQVQAEQQRAREAAVQLAVYRNATANGADPNALLDSASFLRSLGEIDPADATAVGTAIKAAIEANPRLAAEGEGPRPPRPDPTQGRALGGAPLDPRAADLAQIEADLAAAKRR